MRSIVAVSLSLASCLMAGTAHAAPRYVLAASTPPYIEQASRLGAPDANQVIDITLWFAPHNRASLDQRVAQEYDRSSPLYHHWLDRTKLGAMFGATDAEVAAVRDFLGRSGLAVVGGDPGHFFLRARGTMSAVGKALNVQFANFSVRGRVYRANTTDPVIEDAAGAYVATVMGLDTKGFEHPLIKQSDLFKLPASGAAIQGAQSGQATGFNANCFPGTKREYYTTNYGTPTGTYTGNLYESGATGCGYSPQQIATAYGLDKLYKKGYDGTGQYIGIIDWCGSPTIMRDANAFSKRFNLPPLSLRKNFFIVYPQGSADCATPDPEINIDVEWAHAVAPGAAIQLIVPLSADYQDIASAILYELELLPDSILSNSYGSEESQTPASIIDMMNFLIEAGAASGVSINFSSGDDGDFTDQYTPPSVSAPADSPYATAIGGVSLGLTKAGAIQFQAGWGNNEAELAGDNQPDIPYYLDGFLFGSGGGRSAMLAKPAFQAALAGKFRLVPDISWLADPFTGGIIAISVPNASPELQYLVYGGTSLACPMFSALWAIAQQAAGERLGQAAPLLYRAPRAAIRDIVPVGSAGDVTAVLDTGTRTIDVSANALAQPLRHTSTFLSALWNYPLEPGNLGLLTFGTDSGLATAAGWDNVTGLGVANPVGLITFLTPSSTGPSP